MDYPFGIDISFWQESIDFDKMMKADPKPEFIAIRAGQGNYGIDPRFGYNWQKAGIAGLHRIAYHVVEFGVSGNYRLNYYSTGQDSSALTQTTTDFAWTWN